jgi:uncharacterized protein (DUF58 family)
VAKRLRQVSILRKGIRAYQERLTARGRYLLWTVMVLGVLGLDTRRNQVFKLFAVAVAIFLVAALFAFLPRPKVRLACRLPLRAAVLTPLPISAHVASLGGGLPRDLCFTFPRPLKWGSSIVFKPPQTFFVAPRDGPSELKVEFRALRRGRYLLRGPTVRATDPLQLALTREVALPDQVLLVYPRFYSMDDFIAPGGRRYQPGGVPLASSTGDAIEFVGTREYREGDPLRNIHWRSWARLGKPVVREFQEEYFCRIAVILDTFLSPKPTPAEEKTFEAAISVTASIADFFSRSEYLVDVLAAGPDIYEVSAGRSLAYLESILDVLACLEPCPQPPFQAIGPCLFEKLAQTTTVVAVLLDWDRPREDFLRRVKALGTALRVLVVHEGLTRESWQNVGADLGEVSLVTPADVERFLAAPA